MTNEEFDLKKLQKLLKADAKALGVPSGAAEIFIARVIEDVNKNLSTKKLITKADLDRVVYKELKKYHPDFAYVYKNRDKIV